MMSQKYILVTGGAGYIGSHTNKLLSNAGYNTIIFDNLVYGHREFVKWGTFEQGDLLDKNSLRSIFPKYKIDAVVHFAAYAYVGESVGNPQKYYQNNVVGTLNLLDTMLEFGVKKIVFSSTCATYGIPESLPITEEHPQNPINPYGKTKFMIEQILKDYDLAYGLKYVALRYFNASGADFDGELGELHDPETHLIPLAIKAAYESDYVLTVFGDDYDTYDGTCIRDYIHVYDLALAHKLALEYLGSGGSSECFNLGNSVGFSVRDVINEIEKLSGQKVKYKIGSRRAGDPEILIGSYEKIMKKLQWKPTYSDIKNIISSGLRWYILRFEYVQEVK